MALIFLSHSSKNNAEAIALRDWLVAEGWDDFFLDLDENHGIAAGERWERALNEAANRCEAVVFLVSRHWLESRWCIKELHLAIKLNKRLFAVLIEDLPNSAIPDELLGSWQVINLATGSDHIMFRASLPDGSETHVTYSRFGLAKLKNGLVKAGLDAQYFAWPPENDPDRPPYRGLLPLEAEDAGIFFGREAPTIEALDDLRGLKDAAAPRIFLILGASGAGKSSFLRAGLLPRLQRDDQNFLTLPIVRPERTAITGETGFLKCLETAAKAANLRFSRAHIKAAVDAGAAEVEKLLAEISKASSAPVLEGRGSSTTPRLILPIDQAEELFLGEGSEESKPFLALLRDISTSSQSNLIVLMTMRSDSFEYIQTAPEFEGISGFTFSLPPLPRGAYQAVIEGPPARLRDTSRPLVIEASLTAALLKDIETGGGKDALPLLSFTLERLYLEHGGDGDLRRAEYETIGGIRGSIEAAVEHALKAADQDPAIPQDRAARLALLRRALIPWLAGIDPETGAPRRRVARVSEIPAEARPLVKHLVNARLLATDTSVETGEQTIEPAHEALLRQWGLLQGWLDDDLGILSSLENVKRAARDWAANERRADWLAHAGSRLEEAELLRQREDLSKYLEKTETDYLSACAAAERARRDKENEEIRSRIARQKRIIGVSSAAAVVFACIALLAGWQYLEAQSATKRADSEREVAEYQRGQAEKATATAIKETQNAQRNLTFALDATDTFALDLARSLKTNHDIPTADKIFVSQQLDDNFSDLIEHVGVTPELRTRYASLMTSISEMLSNVGRYDLAAIRARKANELLLSQVDSQRGVPGFMLALARAKIALAGTLINERETAKAEQTIQEAEALLLEAERASPGDEADLLGVQLREAKVLLLSDRLQYEDLRIASSEATRILLDLSRQQSGAGQLPQVQRDLFEHTLDMLHMQVEVSRSNYSYGLEELSSQMQSYLIAAKGSFEDGNDPAWKAQDARAAIIRAYILSLDGDPAGAVEIATKAIDQYRLLVTADYGNLRWRYYLAKMLIARSSFSLEREDKEQGLQDLKAATILAVSLRRDSANPVLAQTLFEVIEYSLGRWHARQSEWVPAMVQFAIVGARGKYEYKFSKSDSVLKENVYWTNFGEMTVHIAKRDTAASLKSGRMALAALDSIKNVVGPQIYATRQYFVLSSFLELDPGSVGDQWPDIVKSALDALNRQISSLPNGHQWYGGRSYVLGRNAVALASKGSKEEAGAQFGGAMDAARTAYVLHNANLAYVLDYMYYARERLELLRETGKWTEYTTTAKDARTLFKSVLTADTAKKAFPRWIEFLGELDKGIKQNATAEDLLEEQRLAKRVESDMLGLVKPSTGTNDGQVSLNPQDLDLSKVKAGGEQGSILAVTSRLGFAASTIYPGAWRTLMGTEFDDSLKLFSGTQPFPSAKDAERIQRIRYLELPFYKDGRLLEAEYTDESGTVTLVSLLVVRDLRFFLDGTSPPLHEANAKAPLEIANASEAGAYLRFFSAYLSAEAPFHIVETSSELQWAATATAVHRNAVDRILRPLVVWYDADKQKWLATATIEYTNAVFHALFAVTPTGMVEILQDEPVATDMPLAPPLFTKAGRVDRTIQLVDLTVLGETENESEVDAMYRLAALPESTRPVHYKELSFEAAALELDAFLETGRLSRVSWRNTAEDSLKAGDYKMARRLQDIAVDKWRTFIENADPSDPGTPVAQRKFAGELATMSRYALLVGDSEEALASAREALSIAPEGHEARVNLAHAHMAAGGLDQALVIYKQLASLPSAEEPWLDLAKRNLEELDAAGQYRATIAQFRIKIAALTTLPDQPNPSQQSSSGNREQEVLE